MPDPIPLRPRRDPSAADTRSLVELGQEEPPPVPRPATNPFQEPDWPPEDEPA